MADDQPPDLDEVMLVRVRLPEQPGVVAYYAARRDRAERLAADAAKDGKGGEVEILPARSFAVSAGLTPAEVGRDLRLLGIDVGGKWVQPPSTGQAAQRN